MRGRTPSPRRTLCPGKGNGFAQLGSAPQAGASGHVVKSCFRAIPRLDPAGRPDSAGVRAAVAGCAPDSTSGASQLASVPVAGPGRDANRAWAPQSTSRTAGSATHRVAPPHRATDSGPRHRRSGNTPAPGPSSRGGRFLPRTIPRRSMLLRPRQPATPGGTESLPPLDPPDRPPAVFADQLGIGRLRLFHCAPPNGALIVACNASPCVAA